LIDHYEGLSEDEQVAEDKTAMAAECRGHAVIAVPDELLPEIRRRLAACQVESACLTERLNGPALGGSLVLGVSGRRYQPHGFGPKGRPLHGSLLPDQRHARDS
jgi:hypothetical protein